MRVENIVETGEIARYEQFLLFPTVFKKKKKKKLVLQTRKNQGFVWEMVTEQSPCLKSTIEKPLQRIMGD